MENGKKKQFKSTETEDINCLFTIDNGKALCNLCGTVLTAGHTGNLRKHLKRKHPKKLEDIRRISENKCKATSQTSIFNFMQNTPKTITIQIQRQEIIDACVEMVTKNGRPLSAMEDSGFRRILDPVLNAMSEKLTINRETIRDFVKEKASTMKQNIMDQIQHKIINLKVDSATRLDRSILGINVQFENEGKIVTKTLAMKELKGRHSAANIVGVIETALSDYNVDIRRIYRYNSDNAKTVVAAGKMLTEKQFDLLNLDEEEESYLREEEFDEPLFDQNEVSNLILNKHQHLLKGETCWIHTLQLAICDTTLKEERFVSLIDKGRDIVIKLRTPTVLYLIREKKLLRPILANRTRWNSTYLMLHRLLYLKSFCNNLAITVKEVYLSEVEWKDITAIVDTLEPAYEASILLQNSQLTYSDAFAAWIKMETVIETKNNTFSTLLIKNIRKRSTNLLNSDVMVACVFLDPRYQVLLNDTQKQKAKLHIMEVSDYLKTLKSHSQPESHFYEVEYLESDDDDNVDLFERLLRSHETKNDKQNDGKTKKSTAEISFQQLVQNFDGVERELDKTKNFNIFQYWDGKNEKYGELKEVVKIVFSAPATEVSVERCFSTLKFILSDRRANLNEDMLEDILLLNINN